MASSYSINLGIGTPEGKPLYAKITKVNTDYSHVELPYIEAVAKDKAFNCPSGVIKKLYPVSEHQAMIKGITDYLESLFLKELESENNNSSKHSGNKSGGAKIKTDSGSDSGSKGKKSGSVHHSRGGRKSPSGSGTGNKSESNLAESSNTEDSGIGESRNETV